MSTFTITVLVKFLSVVIATPMALPGGLVVALFGGLCGQLYIRSQMSVKREASKAKSPLLGQYVSVLGRRKRY